MERTLADIVADRDLRALEAYCLRVGSYNQIRIDAAVNGVDSEELEELLYAIS